MDAPSLEMVCAAVNALNSNPDPGEKVKASEWLQEFQKSVYAWKIADEILHKKMDTTMSYMAAHTMRNKIQSSFHEVPVEAHASLRDSLLEHISSIDERTGSATTTQLCLALADLVLLLPDWSNSIIELIQRFGLSSPVALVELLTFLPEEVSSGHLRLGENRRERAKANLAAAVPALIEYLTLCLNKKLGRLPPSNEKIFKCIKPWFQLGVIPLDGLTTNEVILSSFQILSNYDEPFQVHEAATDCICSLLIRLEKVDGLKDGDPLEYSLFNAVIGLEQAYHLSVAHEDHDKAANYCRLFSELGETYLFKCLDFPTSGAHFSMPVFNIVLNCCSHPDYEIADITFNLWYRLSEELFQRKDENLTKCFQPYIERLINALCKQLQLEPDLDGIQEEGHDFTDFRARVVDLIKDVVFIAGSSSVFRHMLAQLKSEAATSWETNEAALFVMHAVAKSLYPSESEIVPQVVESILSMQENEHVAVKQTSIRLLGELSEWLDHHPEYLHRILVWLSHCLHHPLIASDAAIALQNICAECQRHMWPHFDGMVQIVSSIDTFKVKPSAANALIKGVADIISVMDHNQIQGAVRALCRIQAEPLNNLMEKRRADPNFPISKYTLSDPAIYLDRLASIFRNVTPNLQPGLTHPCQEVATELWPVLSGACETYAKDERIMERFCRTLRFTVRCLGTQSAPLLQPMAEQIVATYRVYHHSCFLYVASILVDTYAEIPGCVPGLMEMLTALLEPTYGLLVSERDLKCHPDTVDDFFRLQCRFLQRATAAYVVAPFLNSVIHFALSAISLEHRDANASVMKFLSDLLHCGKSKEDKEDFEIRSATVNALKNEFGGKLVKNLIEAAVFILPQYAYRDIASVLFELMQLDRISVCLWLEQTLKELPGLEGNPPSNFPGNPTSSVTRQQLATFHKSVTSAEDPRSILESLRTFIKLWQ